MSNDHVYYTLSQKIGEDFYRFVPKHVGSNKEVKVKPEFDFNDYKWEAIGSDLGCRKKPI